MDVSDRWAQSICTSRLWWQGLFWNCCFFRRLYSVLGFAFVFLFCFFLVSFVIISTSSSLPPTFRLLSLKTLHWICLGLFFCFFHFNFPQTSFEKKMAWNFLTNVLFYNLGLHESIMANERQPSFPTFRSCWPSEFCSAKMTTERTTTSSMLTTNAHSSSWFSCRTPRQM